jgi:hypothetical protein
VSRLDAEGSYMDIDLGRAHVGGALSDEAFRST